MFYGFHVSINIPGPMEQLGVVSQNGMVKQLGQLTYILNYPDRVVFVR